MEMPRKGGEGIVFVKLKSLFCKHDYKPVLDKIHPEVRNNDCCITFYYYCAKCGDFITKKFPADGWGQESLEIEKGYKNQVLRILLAETGIPHRYIVEEYHIFTRSYYVQRIIPITNKVEQELYK